MFATNFTIVDTYLKHLRGRDNLTKFGPQAHTVASGKGMANYFCSTCGTLMYRVGESFPGMSILRLGAVDDFHLQETKMRPTVEYFIENRVGWLKGVEGIKQVEGFPSQ
ncbi:Mss4-like protein [Daldinia bambusicola]|nr:Mss4-like protein [Daldinia bambusicola]